MGAMGVMVEWVDSETVMEDMEVWIGLEMEDQTSSPLSWINMIDSSLLIKEKNWKNCLLLSHINIKRFFVNLVICIIIFIIIIGFQVKRMGN